MAPEDYRSDRVDRDVQVDEMTLRQKPIGLDIIDSAAKSDDSDSPENYAAQVLASQTPCVFGPSRYREDFVLPVDRAASEFCYRPLYFEQANLERYGTSHGALQPIISGARFFATVPTIPYQIAVYKPCVCRYWLHDYQAGRKAPCWERELPPFSAEGAGLEGLAIYGLILLVP